MTVDWGNVPSYFGGVALILTITVILRDRREKVRGQADRIAAWVQRSSEDGEPHRVVVRNASDLPCVDLAVWMTAGYRSPNRLLLSKTFGKETDGRVKPKHLHAVGPGETVVVFQTDEDVAVRHLEFVDAAGRAWSRVGMRLSRGRSGWRWKLRLWASHVRRRMPRTGA